MTLGKYQLEVEQCENDKNYLDERIDQRQAVVDELKREIAELERERCLEMDKIYEIDAQLAEE